MIRAVAWDIDGTLVDSEPLHLIALKQVCIASGVDISDLPDDHFVGVHIGNVWRELAPRHPDRVVFPDWLADLNKIYCSNAFRLNGIQFAAKTVGRLAGMGLRQVAVSNSNRSVVDANLKALGVREHIDFSISLDDVREGKPDPLPYRLACERLGIPPSDVLAVEDSRTGASSALAAGLPLAYLTDRGGAPDGAVPISCLSELPLLIGDLSSIEPRTQTGLSASN